MKLRYSSKFSQAQSPDGMIYGWQLAKSRGRIPACYHVGIYGRGLIRTYSGGTEEAIYDTGSGHFGVSDMFATEAEANAWLASKGCAKA